MKPGPRHHTMVVSKAAETTRTHLDRIWVSITCKTGGKNSRPFINGGTLLANKIRGTVVLSVAALAGTSFSIASQAQQFDQRPPEQQSAQPDEQSQGQSQAAQSDKQSEGQSEGQSQGENPDVSAPKFDPQTGGSNDRLFWTLPNFLTLEHAHGVAALTSAQKYKLVARTSFDPVEFPFYAFLAGISQADNSESGYGQGGLGYARRFGSNFLDGTTKTFFRTSDFPIDLSAGSPLLSGWQRNSGGARVML